MRFIVFTFCMVISVSVAQNNFEQGKSLFMDGKYENAEPLLKDHLSNNPEDLKTIEYLGDLACRRKDWDTAMEYYKKLVKAQENNAEYHYKYGGAVGMKALEVNKLRAMGLIGDIKRSFKKAAELDSNHIEVRWALVELYMQLPAIIGGSEKTAMIYANELQELSNIDGLLAKGYLAEYSNRPIDAEYYYKKAIQVGGSITCYQKLTDLYENKTKQPDKAIQNIEEAQGKHKRNNLHYQIGKICAKYNVQLEKGIQCLNTYITNHTSEDGVPKSWAYFRLAQLYKHKGDKGNALQYIDLALAQVQLKPFKTEKEHILNM